MTLVCTTKDFGFTGHLLKLFALAFGVGLWGSHGPTEIRAQTLGEFGVVLN